MRRGSKDKEKCKRFLVRVGMWILWAIKHDWIRLFSRFTDPITVRLESELSTTLNCSYNSLLPITMICIPSNLCGPN